MAVRRTAEGERAIETAADARNLARLTRERADRLRTTPGLLDGALAELHGALERVMREYPRLSRGRLSAFTRDLEGIARRARDLEDAGRLTARHAKLIGQALQHTRRVHFWNARRALAKIDRMLEPVREWQSGLDAYRTFHRKAVQRVRDAEATVAKLRSVPRPGVGPDEAKAFRALVEACNRAADEAWVAQTHRPVAEAIRDVASHPDADGLGLLSTQEFACLRALGDTLEAQPELKESIGTRPLSELVTTSEYSVAKWDRVYPQAAPERRRLQDLFHQLRPVVSGAHGTPFESDAAPAALGRRMAAWRAFSGPAAGAWSELADLVASGRIPTIQESAREYDRFGDLAHRAWDGSLAEDIEKEDRELKAARSELAKLPSPDTLVG